MRIRLTVALAFVLTACMGSFTIAPKSNTSATPTPAATAMHAANPTPSASVAVVQASATPQIAMSAGPSVAPSTAKTAEPLKSPTPQPTPTIAPTPTPPPKTLWTQVVPGVEVMDDSMLEFSDSNGNLIKPRRVSGVVVHTGEPRTPQEGKRELWVQFNELPANLTIRGRPCDPADFYTPCASRFNAPGFMAYDSVAATWSFRVMSTDIGCAMVMDSSSGYMETFRYVGSCHPDDYPLLVNQYSDDDWVSTLIAATPIVTAQGSRSFTVEMQQSTERWYGVSYTRTIDSSPVLTIPITEDFYRVLYAPDFYAYYKDEYGTSPTGHSTWHNDRLYYTTQYRIYKGLSYQEWSNLPRVIAWWSKSDNSWRVTELPFVKNEEVRSQYGYLRYGNQLYMAIDPVTGTFFFVVPEYGVNKVYRSDRVETANPVPFEPRRYWGTLYKVSASFIHDNGVLVSVK